MLDFASGSVLLRLQYLHTIKNCKRVPHSKHQLLLLFFTRVALITEILMMSNISNKWRCCLNDVDYSWTLQQMEKTCNLATVKFYGERANLKYRQIAKEFIYFNDSNWHNKWWAYFSFRTFRHSVCCTFRTLLIKIDLSLTTLCMYSTEMKNIISLILYKAINTTILITL